MLNKTEENKIKGFMADEMMAGAVKKVLTETFLRSQKTADVNTLAAERIALILLDEAYKELKRYSNPQGQKERSIDNPGL